MSSDRPLRIGQRVRVTTKDVCGRVAYFGNITIATGKWVGVILDEPKGKNNGSIRGHSYFTCEENYGMFVRLSQLIMLDDDDNPLDPSAQSPEDLKGSRSRLSSITQAQRSRPTTVRRKISPAQCPKPMSLSVSSSRQSLAGSRQSLSNMSVSSPGERATTPDAANKRSSFVETNFVETLNPQFTPGQSITSPMGQPTPTPITLAASSAEDKIALLQAQQEIATLKSTVEDLNEKLETIRIKRSEDREKLKEFERVKMQLDQMTEFKSKIMESQAALQRDLQRAKLEAREAIAARDAHAEEMADLSETVEMATLDREMAEEKAETLQLELDATKEKLEEALLDMQLLKAELDAAGIKEGTGGSQYELKQLEQQNARLRDTLVRLRDLSAHEKHHMQKMQKDLDQKKSEITELGRTKEKLSSRVEELEAQIADLQEQVDAALGAEEMVEQLGERKMALEDEVAQLKEEVAELEALQEVHEQLVESNHELEMDLREELEMSHAATREAIREREAALENVLDRDSTISKFRELVQKLNEQCNEYRNRLDEKDNKSAIEVRTVTEQQMEMIDKVSRAGTRAVDLQLRALQLQQAAEHAELLKAYMPDHLMLRGGDHDAIQSLLLIPRMICKADILLSQLREKFPMVSSIDKDTVVKTHSVIQYSFRCKMQFYLHMLLSVLHQYAHSLKTCSTETLLKVAAALPELLIQEMPLDAALELIKANRIDENSSTEAIEKCYICLVRMQPSLLGGQGTHQDGEFESEKTEKGLQKVPGEAASFKAWCAAISAAMESLAVDSSSIKVLLPSEEESPELAQLLELINVTTETLLQQLKSIKRRLPTDPNITSLGLDPEWWERVAIPVHRQVSRAAWCVQEAARVSAAAATIADPTPLTSAQINKLWASTGDKHYHQEEAGAFMAMKKSLQLAIGEIATLAQFTQQQEYQINSSLKQEPKTIPPIAQRAQLVKKQLEETKALTLKLENKEADLRELKKILKAKQDEMSEMQIRKELAEKKLSSAARDQELQVEKLTRKLEDAQNQLKRKEKEFEETMDHLQQDIDSLESERGALRDKLKLYGKKTDKAGNISISPEDSVLSSPKASAAERSISRPNYDTSDNLHVELILLQGQLEKEREERMILERKHCQEVLERLAPIEKPSSANDAALNQLRDKFTKWQFDWTMFLAKSGICTFPDDPSKYQKTLEDHKTRQKLMKKQLLDRLKDIQNEIRDEYLRRRPWRCVETDLAKFPTAELTRATTDFGSIEVGTLEVQVPKGTMSLNSGVVHLTREQLSSIQLSLDRLGEAATLKMAPSYLRNIDMMAA